MPGFGDFEILWRSGQLVLINPAIITYDLTLLAVSWKRWWFVPLLIGWLAVFLSNSPLSQHGLPYSLVTLATLILILDTLGQVKL
jgi:hypothetical protein